ncbi:hypothetical protein OAG24_01295 [bacterium]|nr:hypothetical protein [bacterium]
MNSDHKIISGIASGPPGSLIINVVDKYTIMHRADGTIMISKTISESPDQNNTLSEGMRLYSKLGDRIEAVFNKNDAAIQVMKNMGVEAVSLKLTLIRDGKIENSVTSQPQVPRNGFPIHKNYKTWLKLVSRTKLPSLEELDEIFKSEYILYPVITYK